MSCEEPTETKHEDSSLENSPTSMKKQNSDNYHDDKEESGSGSDSDKSYKNVSIKLILNSKSVALQKSDQLKKHIVLPPLDSNPDASSRDSSSDTFDYQKQYFDHHYYQPRISPTGSQTTKLSLQNSPNYSPQIPSLLHRQPQIPQFLPQYLPSHPHQMPPQLSHPAEVLSAHPVEYPMPPYAHQQMPLGYSYGMAGSSSDSAADLENKRGRRFRRRYNQILRKYNCSYPGCSKSYGSLNHLNTHIVTKKHGQRKSKADFQVNEDSRQHLIYLHHRHHHHHPAPSGEYSSGHYMPGSTAGNYWFGYQGAPPLPMASGMPPAVAGFPSHPPPPPPPPPHTQAPSGGNTPPGMTHPGPQPGSLPFAQGQNPSQKTYAPPPPPPSAYYIYPPGSVQNNYPPLAPSHYPGPGWVQSVSAVTPMPAAAQLPMVATSSNHSPRHSPKNTSPVSLIPTTAATTSEP